MVRHIVIIGGGISGLTTLHYLKKKYSLKPNVQIRLLEKSSCLGGTISTLNSHLCQIERGPNGFLDNKRSTLEFLSELNCVDQLITAKDTAKVRYVRLGKEIYPVPTNPNAFFSSKILSVLDKMRILSEILRPRGFNHEETVYEFFHRRFGKKATDIFVDCMVSGIYGGDIHQLNMHQAFSSICDLEDKYGSVIKGFMSSLKGMPRPRMHSFKNGMGQLIDILAAKYADFIQTSCEVKRIDYEQNRFIITVDGNKIYADDLFLSLQAYAAGNLLNHLSPILSEQMRQISYVPMMVVGLVYRISNFRIQPQGFGYLIPSSEQTSVLGVLLESNVYEHRSPTDLMTIRVMIGGAHHLDILQKSEEEIYNLALNAVSDVWPIDQMPVHKTLIQWPKAIPQYNQNYAQIKSKIELELKYFPNLHLISNYWKGISFNDCIQNARLTVEGL